MLLFPLFLAFGRPLAASFAVLVRQCKSTLKNRAGYRAKTAQKRYTPDAMRRICPSAARNPASMRVSARFCVTTGQCSVDHKTATTSLTH